MLGIFTLEVSHTGLEDQTTNPLIKRPLSEIPKCALCMVVSCTSFFAKTFPILSRTCNSSRILNVFYCNVESGGVTNLSPSRQRLDALRVTR